MKKIFILLISLFMISSAYALNSLNDTQRSYSFYSQNSTSDLIIDLANNENGTCEGMGASCSFSGGLLVFDGIDNYVEIPTTNIENYPLTLSTWIKTTSTTRDFVFGGRGGTSSNSYPRWDLRVNAVADETEVQGYVKTESYSNNNQRQRVGTGFDQDINNGSWRHLLVIYRPDNINIFVDGVNQTLSVSNSASGQDSMTDFNIDLFIGAFNNDGTSVLQPFNGQMANFLLYDRKLTDLEISFLNESGRLYNPNINVTLAPNITTPSIVTNLTSFYKNETFLVDLTTTSIVNMSYSLNGEDFEDICENCDSFDLNLSATTVYRNSELTSTAFNIPGFNTSTYYFKNNLPTREKLCELVGGYKVVSSTSSVNIALDVIRWNGTAWEDRGEIDFLKTLECLGVDGLYTIDFRSEDTAGVNWNNQSFTLDTTPPVITNNLSNNINSYNLGVIGDNVSCSDTNLVSCTIKFFRDGNTENLATNYTFTFNGNQTYLINATDSAGFSTIEQGYILVNPQIEFSFVFNATNVEDYSFGGRQDVNGIVKYSVFNDNLVLGENTLVFNKLNYVLQNFSFNLTNTSTSFAFSVTPSKINVNIYNRTTENLITDPITLQLIGNVGDTLTTTNGTAILRAIDGVSGQYEIIATSPLYETETIFFEYTNQEVVNLDMYLIPSNSSNLGSVTVEVKDTLSFFIEGAVVNLLEWKAAQSSFVSVAQCETFSNGKCSLNVELDTKLYKFQASKDGISAETTSLIIDSSGQTIPITLQDLFLTSVPNSDNILGNFTETTNNLTNTSLLRLQWSTVDNTNAKACIKLYEDRGLEKSLLAQNCTTSNSGVIFMTANINTPNTRFAIGSVEDAFNEYNIDTFTFIGTGALSKALEDINFDFLALPILMLLAISAGILFGNIYIALVLAVIVSFFSIIFAGSIVTLSTAVVLSIIAVLTGWGSSKR